MTCEFDISFHNCDHTTDGRRDCHRLPTFVVVITANDGQSVWSAACGVHILSTMNEAASASAQLSLPSTAMNYMIHGADRRITRGLGAPVRLIALDEVG